MTLTRTFTRWKIVLFVALRCMREDLSNRTSRDCITYHNLMTVQTERARFYALTLLDAFTSHRLYRETLLFNFFRTLIYQVLEYFAVGIRLSIEYRSRVSKFLSFYRSRSCFTCYLFATCRMHAIHAKCFLEFCNNCSRLT